MFPTYPLQTSSRLSVSWKAHRLVHTALALLMILAIEFSVVWGNQQPASAGIEPENYPTVRMDGPEFAAAALDLQGEAGQEPPGDPEPGLAGVAEPEAPLTTTNTTSDNFIFLPGLIIGEPANNRGNDNNAPIEINPEGTYYVATNGSDSSGNGSSSKPWKTINTAVKKVPDGSKIVVRPGTYNGKVLLDRVFSTGIIIQSDKAYQAKLRNSGDKVITGTGAGYILEGFDIAHNPGATGMYVIQLQDPHKNGNGGERITLRDNVIHDSYNNDLLKINNGAKDIVVEGNMFYNMGGPAVDNHIDVNSAINVTIQDNIFFNDFADSGRSNGNNTGHYIVIKDSNGASDGISGSSNIQVRRNVFLNWEGEVGSAFIGLGDGASYPFYQAYNVMIENNLFLGNTNNKIHGPVKVIGAKDVTFRNNTIQGDLPSNSFSMRLMKSDSGLKNVNIRFYNNIWSDPAGTMGADAPGSKQRFSNTPRAETQSFSLNSNLYWNNGAAIPSSTSDLINYTNDSARITANPKLPANLASITPPCWDSGRLAFDDGSANIRQAFNRLVIQYGKIASDSAARDKANSGNAPADDILKNPRNQGAPDIGAYEYRP